MSHPDPIASAEGRFPLGRPRGVLELFTDLPSAAETRPFALRQAHAFTAVRNRIAEVPAHRYDPQRQLAVLADDKDVPLFKHTNPVTQETSGYPDGQQPSAEEIQPDWQPG